ncbi:MAG: outer membrane beta-barrel protein, partial [Candidatus Deferrimicrobium sp.]
LDPHLWASLLTLTILEIILGIDNLIFISLVSNRLPASQQSRARRTGLALAVITRLLLLAGMAWLVGLTRPLFAVFGHPVSLRDLILAAGGLFLLAKGTVEIHATVEGVEEEIRQSRVSGFWAAIAQILVLDVVFSLDSVITAIGMAQHLPVMAAAVIIAIAVMLLASESLSRFVNEHLSVKLLALSFLILVGMALIADGIGFHIPRGYLYFAIAFSAFVEFLNLQAAKRRRRKAPEPVPAHDVLPFRILLLAAALLLPPVLFPREAVAEWGVEVTPYAGYAIGGSFEDNTTGADLDAREGGIFGLLLDLSDSPETQYELFYGFQRTKVTGGGTLGGDPLFDLDIHYLHLGGTYMFPGDKIRPYIAGGLGATHFVPSGSGLNRKTFFSLSLGGGAKIPLSSHVGLRLEGRGLLTVLPDTTEIFCVSSGGAACRVSVKGDVFGQFLLMAGITFSL